VVFAQDDEEGKGWPFDIRDRMKSAVAEALGIEVQEYEDALATARGQVLEEAVAEGYLSQEQADRMRERGAEGFGPGKRGGFVPRAKGRCEHRMPGKDPHAWGPSSEAVLTELLGLTAEELRAELKDGKTLADVTQARGVELDAVVDALMAPMDEKLAQAVKAGKLSQEEADEKLELMGEKILKALEEGLPLWKPAPGRFPREGSRIGPPNSDDVPGQGES
jgi:hypothetical protein